MRERLGDPHFLRTLNGWLTWFWLANFPPVVALYLMVTAEAFQKVCLLYLALVSVWANVAGHASSWQAARVECKQFDDADVQQVLDAVQQLATEG